MNVSSMIVGFTGTRQGMTDAQCAQVEAMLKYLGCTEFHHGDCIGADSQAAYLVHSMGNIKIVCHPPSRDIHRAFVPLRANDRMFPPKSYIVRNHEIVDTCDHLFVAPKDNTEQVRSGTWATYRYARRQGRPTTIIER